jgi:formylglycine-generating enzyme required for sulfatase activity
MADPSQSPEIRATALDLLEKWLDARDRGTPVSPESLCQGQPEILRALQDQILALTRCDHALLPSEPPAASLPLSEPRTLLGRYRLENLIGEGGHGQVWRALDTQLDRRVAVKVPKPTRRLAPNEIDQLLAEARHVAKLRHPAIVPVYDACPEGAAHVVISEWIDGPNLEAILSRGPLAPKQALALAAQLARALEYSHAQGIIHRDIKPANLLIDNQGELKVCDFGIAASQKELLGLSDQRFTLAYASPEQVQGQKADQRSDIWSVGVVLCEMLTGRLPFGENTALEQRQAILHRALPLPEGIEPATWSICARALEKNPSSRFQTAGDMAEAIEDELLRLELGESERAARAETGRRLLATGSFVGIALLVFGLLFALSSPGNFASGTPSGLGSLQAQFFPAASEESVLKGMVGSPGLLDCRNGVSKDIAQAMQREWAAFLGVPVEKSFHLVNDLEMRFVLIPPGIYRAGSDAPDAPPQEAPREITISRPFYLARHQTTQREWEELMGENPSWFSRLGGGAPQVQGMNTAQFPVESVSLEKAWEACGKLSARNAGKCFLPTEWQWEYACRAGATGPFHWGESAAPNQAAFQVSADTHQQELGLLEGHTERVESHKPNAFGLYDMHGNVMEWCADWYVADPGAKLIDPFSPRGESPVARGGSWRDPPANCRASRRGPQVFIPSATGFRFAMLAE